MVDNCRQPIRNVTRLVPGFYPQRNGKKFLSPNFGDLMTKITEGFGEILFAF